jgi:hypothetical protein
VLGPLNLYQWVLFVGQHEARHAGQLQDLARLLASQAPEPTAGRFRPDNQVD